MLHATTTDAELVQQIKDWRDDAGWREFHRRYAPAIAAHARRSGLTHDEAEEVVQATMIKVASYVPEFEYDRTVCRFRTWLNQIVNQRILGLWHQRRRTHLPAEAWRYLKERVADTVNPAADPVAQAQMEQQMIEVCLARARLGVPPRHWQIFEANTLQGLDARTVAQRHGTTAANVWVIRHRMIRRLRTEWRALLHEPFAG
jgi:RNA polymerase sigma factor (sigma-70 family)